MNSFTKLLKWGFLPLLVCLTILNTSAGAKTVKGIVVDNSSSKPVPGGIVMLIEKNKIRAMAVADSSGVFTFDDINMEKVVLRAKRIGYAQAAAGPFGFPKNDTLKMVIKLDPQDVVYDEIVIKEKMVEEYLNSKHFYDRQKEGWGKFLAPKDLKNQNFLNVEDIFRRVPGMVVDSKGRIYSIRGYQRAQGKGAQVMVYLDGVVMDSEFITQLNPNDVAAIEFYKSGTVAPMQFGGAKSSVGVLLVWTK